MKRYGALRIIAAANILGGWIAAVCGLIFLVVGLFLSARQPFQSAAAGLGLGVVGTVYFLFVGIALIAFGQLIQLALDGVTYLHQIAEDTEHLKRNAPQNVLNREFGVLALRQESREP